MAELPDQSPPRPKLTLGQNGEFRAFERPEVTVLPATSLAAPSAFWATRADLTPEEVVWDPASRVSMDGVTKLRDSGPHGGYGEGGGGGCGDGGC